jgi:hypothetical protein
MELIGLATLNSVPQKHDDMQAVAFVPEMSHFVVLRVRIFVDQLYTDTVLALIRADFLHVD